jgi:2-phosphosulfolactate phosphatase
MRQLRVHFLPELVTPEKLGERSLLFEADDDDAIDHACVVIDVLRATTTIVAAVAAGARFVVPCLTVEEARARAIEIGPYVRTPGVFGFFQRFRAMPTTSPTRSVLGGERRGLKIDGFALGNSPAEYTCESVGGKIVVMTTTNGTKALLHARGAQRILVGAFVNLSAICSALAAYLHVDLLCAGTDGQITREDVLFAGAVVAQMSEQPYWTLDDQAAIVRDAWQQVAGRVHGADLKTRLAAAMRASQGGRNLIEIGMAADIDFAADVDRFDVVPLFEPNPGRIKAIDFRAAATPGRQGP